MADIIVIKERDRVEKIRKESLVKNALLPEPKVKMDIIIAIKPAIIANGKDE